MALRTSVNAMLKRLRTTLLARLARYTAVRAVSLAFTVVVAVYLIILIANLGGFVDVVIRNNISWAIAMRIRGGWLRDVSLEERMALVEETQAAMEEAAGLNEPFMLRCFRWLGQGLRLDWGEDMRAQILDSLPRTLLLFGPANLLLFFASVFVAAPLARKYGRWMDRFIVMLSPLSSVPAWVLGIVLNLLSIRVLGGLSTGGVLDAWPGEFTWGYLPILLKRMLLPFLAIFLSGFIQSVYAWRTFFLIYASEDHVEMAKAKGLPAGMLERRYILRPVLPYLVTSFALLFVNLWQEVIVLEQFFKVEGIGRLFWGALHRFNTPMIVALVTAFAYLLAITIFLLDIIYALVDPRVRIDSGAQKDSAALGARRPSLRERLEAFRRALRRPFERRARPSWTAFLPSAAPDRPRNSLLASRKTLRDRLEQFKPALREIVRHPSALFGLSIIVVMIGLSVYAVIAIPYDEMIARWREDEESWRYNPQNAYPTWVNLFRKDDLPKTFILDSRERSIDKSVRAISEDMTEISFSFPLDFPYEGFPQDLSLYFEAQYDVKSPHVALTWVRPDGREIDLLTDSLRSSRQTYIFSQDESLRRKLNRRPFWRVDLELSPVRVLFIDPQPEDPVALEGHYELRVQSFVFEEGADVDAKFILYGQVYGLAGTDHRRRDLLVPLLWGMPVALSFGILAAVSTSLITMMIAAIGAWFGGWMDAIIQRITEVNLILPFLPVSLMIYILYSKTFWVLLGVTVLLSIFGPQIKNYRSIFLQMKGASYIEAARSYGAGDWRIVFHYLIPRIIPVLVPQLVILVPGYVFLEATLAFMGMSDPVLPTWGKLITDGLSRGIYTGDYHVVLQPLALLLLVGFAFVMLGVALERIFEPRLRER
ncbi:MAG: ABC transporter permease subunit [Chloroflexia bacterium]|nr:ABC transporter permease subunit [Chloroflexia bacterium]